MERTRRIIVLGSTGSIGTATLEVVAHLAKDGGPAYRVVGLAAGSNAALVARQAAEHGVGHVAVADEAAARALPQGVTAFAGPDAASVGAMPAAPTIAPITRSPGSATASTSRVAASGPATW